MQTRLKEEDGLNLSAGRAGFVGEDEIPSLDVDDDDDDDDEDDDDDDESDSEEEDQAAAPARRQRPKPAGISNCFDGKGQRSLTSIYTKRCHFKSYYFNYTRNALSRRP